MSNFPLMKSGFEPIGIQAESRARYIAAIRTFQERDDSSMPQAEIAKRAGKPPVRKARR